MFRQRILSDVPECRGRGRLFVEEGLFSCPVVPVGVEVVDVP